MRSIQQLISSQRTLLNADTVRWLIFVLCCVRHRPRTAHLGDAAVNIRRWTSLLHQSSLTNCPHFSSCHINSFQHRLWTLSLDINHVTQCVGGLIQVTIVTVVLGQLGHIGHSSLLQSRFVVETSNNVGLLTCRPVKCRTCSAWQVLQEFTVAPLTSSYFLSLLLGHICFASSRHRYTKEVVLWPTSHRTP